MAKLATLKNKSLFIKDEDVNKSIYTASVQDKIDKSFVAGTGITPQTQPDGAAFRMESIDPNTFVTTFSEDDFTIYRDIPKEHVDNTVEKYVTYYNHGRVGHSRFVPEIGIGSVNDPGARQKTVTMKFISDTKQQSLALQLSKTTTNTTDILEMSAVNVIAKTIEWGIFYGDADLSRDGKDAGLEFDGLAKLIDEDNIVDVRGGALTPELLNKAAVLVGKGFGVADSAYMPIGVKADFVNKFLGAQRVVVPASSGEGMQVGFNIVRFMSARGNIKLNGSTVMDMDNILDETAPVSNDAPNAPTVQAQAATAQEGQFLANDVTDKAGNVVVPKEVGVELSYKVVAVGRADSRPSTEAKATPANATDGIKLTITLDGLSSNLPDYVAIYRKSLIDGKYYLIARVAASQMKGNAITFVDKDATIAGTADVFVGQMSPEVITLLELAPMTRLNLAITTSAVQFSVLWYGALRLTMPKRFVMLHNVRYANDYTEMEFNN